MPLTPPLPRSEEAKAHDRLVRRCYQQALTRLRQEHDEEFHQILASVYEANGLSIHKRVSRQQARTIRQREAGQPDG